jgi:hypothetical protein
MFFSVFRFDEALKVGQAGLPKSAILLEPCVDSLEWFRIELIHAVSTFAMFIYEMGASEEAEVLRNRRAGDGKSFGDLSSGLTSLAEQIEDRSTSGIGEGLESGLAGMPDG